MQIHFVRDALRWATLWQMKNEMRQLMDTVEAATGEKVNWGNVFNPNAQHTFGEWTALQMIRAKFPVPQRVCAITDKTK